MKNIGFKLLLLVLLLPQLIVAADKEGKHKKTKIIREEYQVGNTGDVSIYNEYGQVNVVTWNENKVSIIVTISVDGNNLDDVEEQIDDIDSYITKSGNHISAKTKLESLNRGWNVFSWIFGKSTQTNFKINYEVKMPEWFDLNIHNDYGNIYIDRLTGKLNLNADYGRFEIGELLHEDNVITTDYFSKSTISFIKGGKITADYSKIYIDHAYKVVTVCDYTKLKIGTLRKLKYSNDYGSIHVDNVKEVVGSGDYQSRYFGGVHYLSFKGDYGSIKVTNLLPDFDAVNITSDYVSIKIDNTNKVAYQLTINQEYGSFSQSNLHITKQINDNSEKYIKAYYKNENASSKIKIIEDFGSIRIDN